MSIPTTLYGPEEAFRALGGHTHLAPYLALAMAVTVFVIALAYNQLHRAEKRPAV